MTELKAVAKDMICGAALSVRGFGTPAGFAGYSIPIETVIRLAA